ncbi:M43 family zinc metalloprotease [Flavobacterium cellulosilyticum]|uniref:T9SS type A sorting domain-containing protein n=1 Tax=Flavobacterium cellulosilyticum TaxID=2541731 RepID=A0A4R5CHC4_9FLAO|nr:M43 family zinc metalloprotease [Flavobacterium cellulosilyticum]TDD99598.1 T9SS type A sorting domain-containing protein [Flavobacterium cellulosilyticum]
MKTFSSYFTHKLLIVIVCLLASSTNYSQDNISPGKTVFGKTVTSKNINPTNGLIRCATNEYELFLQEKNPKRRSAEQFETWITPLVNSYKASRANSKTSGTIITIPVVVHVIHNGQAIGVAPNITDAQVLSQITVLNQDYRKLLGSPGYNINPVGADVEIQFTMAQQDPNGNPTNGIDRVSLCEPSWTETELDITVKPATIWNPSLYMNLWCVKFTDDTILGYAQFPDNSGLSGVDSTNGTANSDGVVSSYSVFGSNAFNDGSFILDKTYNKGRTMTHEVGHWLGLRHIWGDASCGNDYCVDTPIHHDANYDCPTKIPMSCDVPAVPEMIQNYMDYTDDSCMNIFTQNQKDRMLTVMNNSPRRKELKTSTKATTIPLFANDAEIKMDVNCPIETCDFIPNQITQQITIYNRGTTTLTSATLNYQINGGSNIPYTWNGSLGTNKSARFNLTINSTANGIVSAILSTVNGSADQRTSNDTATGTFIIPRPPTNYTFNDLQFNLQLDYFGSETTWELKDGSGKVKFSGGPYKDTYKNATTPSVIPTLITENWTLADNQCYTFTIKDAASDGICCGNRLGDSGDGFFSITSLDAFSVIKSGSVFASSESVSFIIDTQAVQEFSKSKDIYLFPNPTKDVLNIRIPNIFNLPKSYSIYNIAGQIVTEKKILKGDDLTINTSYLSSGTYLLNIEKEGLKRVFKFIKE